MLERYLNLKFEHRNIVIMLAISIGVFCALTPLFLIEQGPYAMGWLLGSLLSVLCYISMYKGNEYLLSNSNDPKNGYLAVLFYGARFLIMGASLIISAICTFQSGWFNGFNLFNFWTTAAGYLLLFVYIPIITLFDSKKGGK